MEHHAFLFDTERYHDGMEDLILDASRFGNTDVLEKYIDENRDSLKSPYTADPLDENWRDELVNGDVQELADFILTRCYDPEGDIGLGEDWEALCGAMEELDLSGGTEYYFVGEEIQRGNFVLDPSGMGFGIIEPDNVELIRDELESFTAEMEKNDDELLVELYRSLIEIYEAARIQSKGLLLFFL